MASGEFSVYQFFPDIKEPNDCYERVLRFVSDVEAVTKAHFLTTNVSARMGFTQRVIITSGDDTIAFEWIYGKGIVFPPQEPEKES
jgi:hypothetical protein